ncbi:C10 family peptidase [Porphyromonas pogonae]|uniref:C10 family peptidase n=1 Tax=Porphyromonas pogonae TaxID=867595 RepID=UPI002E76A0C1|nr:C10 family peptidase [Porphyromonas pogonae]
MSNFNRFWRLLLAGSAVLILFSCTKDELGSRQESTTEPTESGFVTEKQALDIAATFMESENLAPGLRTTSVQDLKVIYTDIQSSDLKSATSSNQNPSYYVIDVNKKGFVIVSGSDATYPVLGYSTESRFTPQNIPANMQQLLAGYSKEVKYAWKYIKTNEKTVAMRNAALRGKKDSLQDTVTVAPLLGDIHWDQSPYYNDYCPKGCPVGCVATAAAQIMRYWEYPESGTGKHSYNHPTYGTQSFDYNYKLDWKAMPKHKLTKPDSLVAKFCYGVAVGINMGFTTEGSGAYQFDVPTMLQKHYKYPKTVASVNRWGHSDKEWIALVKRELDAKRPVQYAGSGSGGGHSFVCDGYSKNDYFHINWGWGGMSDGYFKLNALDPDNLGTGGGDGGFNKHQEIVIGFAPGQTPPPGPDPDPDPNPTPDPDAPKYCTSASIYTQYLYIKEVTIGNMSNVTGGSETGYGDYTQKKIIATAGTSLACRFVPGVYDGGLYNNYWGAWIDLDNNGIFESSEMILNQNTSNVINGNLNLPKGLKPGSYRVRVTMKYDAQPAPCETFNHGEVEDYTLVIK